MDLESSLIIAQRKGKLDAAEQLNEAIARAVELEKQVEKLGKDLDVKIKEKEQLEARVVEAEKRASEFSSKVGNVSPMHMLSLVI